MAGQPKRRGMREELERLTREYFENDPAPTVVDYVACQLENGETIADIARRLSQTLGYDVPREWVTGYVHSQEGAAEVVRTARTRASHTWAEKAIDAVKAPVEDSVGVAQANNQSRTFLRIAEAYDSGSYAQSKGVNVSINVAQLHLQALQAYNREALEARQLGSEVTGGSEIPILPSNNIPSTDGMDGGSG